jgi:TolA-binding protein
VGDSEKRAAYSGAVVRVGLAFVVGLLGCGELSRPARLEPAMQRSMPTDGHGEKARTEPKADAAGEPPHGHCGPPLHERANETPQRRGTDAEDRKRLIQIGRCSDLFVRADRQFRANPSGRVFDTASLESSIPLFRMVLSRCSGTDYEVASLFSLSLGLFFTGQYAAAAAEFRDVATRFPASRFNEDGYSFLEAIFLDTCARDQSGMEAFRKGAMAEFRARPAEALEHYRASARSLCLELRRRSVERLEDLQARLRPR